MPGKRVAVIGAGSSGLAAIKCCLDEGLEPRALERTDGVGGLWRFREKVRDNEACVMRSTVSNTSKEMSAFSDFPHSEATPLLMHNTVVHDYFRRYADNFDLWKYIRFNCQVTQIRRADSYEETGRWTVSCLDHQTGQSEVDTYDAVMVCTGHHAQTHVPSFPGLADFQGLVVHSHDFRPTDDLRGKTFLVVGMGNSAADVAVELSQYGQVYLSTRRGAWMLPCIASNGLPTDMTLQRRRAALINSWLPMSWLQASTAAFMNHFADHHMLGFTPKHSPLSQTVFLNDDIVARVACGAVKVTEDVKRFTATGVEFKDGRYEEVDMVVMATGYIIGFPFIEKEVLDVQNNEVLLHHYMFPPSLPHPTLAVIGCVQPNSCIWVVAEMQSRLATRVFKGIVTLPSREEMTRGIQKREEVHKNLFNKSLRHTIEVDWLAYLDQLAGMVGCKPNIGKLLVTDPVLAFHVLCGPAYPYHYRLHGPGQWSGARHAILTAMDRVRFPFRQRRSVPCNPQAAMIRVAQWLNYPPPLLVCFLLAVIGMLLLHIVLR